MAMWDWSKYFLFKWGTRLGVLLVACASVQHILIDQLGYRMEFEPMVVIALITIIVVRLWMPWGDD